MRPKWQRAKIRDNVEIDPRDRRLEWVEYGPPINIGGLMGYRTNRPELCGMGGRRCVQVWAVELLPEFSFDDDPDAESRQ